MSGSLQHRAVQAVKRVQKSSFYSEDKPNPVFLALEQDINGLKRLVKKRQGGENEKADVESNSRASNTLFEMWNKYEERLPAKYYQEKLLELGDFLVSVREYTLALWQCYERYLTLFGDVNVGEILDVDTFRKVFFPNGFQADNVGLTFRALMGKSICEYQMVRATDPKLQNRQSVDKCINILNFLRLVMQVVMPKESLCWLVYNGTIHIYSISRHLMSLGHSVSVLEYLLWASMCMEVSVPLMSLRYLSWRSTLYTAVCQCYFDCKAGQHAENFARRGLQKISDLLRLLNQSSEREDPRKEKAFNEATIKMSIMVFKRNIFETRRKPKGVLRPKTRANLKETFGLPWPRTQSEKMLAEMFEGSAAQFLALLESLSDCNRRTLQTSPPASDHEPEILDVYCELMMAAQEILAGGGGNKAQGNKTQMALGAPPLGGLVERPLMEMAINKEDGVPLSSVIRFVKLAFNLEHMDVFDALVEPVLSAIAAVHNSSFAWDEKCLELLQIMQKLNTAKRGKRSNVNLEEEKDKEDPANAEQGALSSRGTLTQDDLINLADVLMSIVNGPYQQDKIEIDIVVDAALFLWNKVKLVFQKYQTGSVDNPRYLQKMDNPTKWMYLLDTIHQVLCWCGISSVDPALTAEVVLRLALIYESSAQLETMDDPKSSMKESKTSLSEVGLGQETGGADTAQGRNNSTPGGGLPSLGSARTQLQQARHILELGLLNVSSARQAVALNDGKNIADVGWLKSVVNDTEVYAREANPEVFKMAPIAEVTEGVEDELSNVEDLIPESMKGRATAVWNTVKDLHLELILIYHRVCLKLADMGPDPSAKAPKTFRRTTCSKNDTGNARTPGDYVENFDELLSGCRRNNLSKALLYMQRAQLMDPHSSPSLEQSRMLEEAVKCIQKAQVEEKRLYHDNTTKPAKPLQPTAVPPPPLLLSRTDTSMVFKPAPFQPLSGQKVAWYRLFARSAAGSNVKVRLSDFGLPGTGEEVPAFGCQLRVTGLTTNERFVFAVAAYTQDGTMIGGGIGESTKPILASHPMPVLMTWAFLSQIAFQVSCNKIARQACSILWDHFVIMPPEPEGVTYVTHSQKGYQLKLFSLNQRAVCLSSPVLLRQFLTSIFISVDICSKEGELFCDIICDKGPLYDGQMRRLAECEKMLVGLELAGWLNEANMALQGVVQCYGLLAPLLYHKIPSPSIILVLKRCHAVLQEIPIGLIQKRQTHITDSLVHMVACITYHMAKVLRIWGQKSLSNSINEAGRRLLTVDGSDKDRMGDPDKPDTAEGGDALSTMSMIRRKKLKSKDPRSREDSEGPVNEELKALEAHILSLTKAAASEHDLTGNEDPTLLHAYIAFLPSKLAYKEVLRFKKRSQFLEFFVLVAQKGLTESQPDMVKEWCEECMAWLLKRNEAIYGNKAHLTKYGGAITIVGDDPKKFAAAMVEYGKGKGDTPRSKPGGKKEGAAAKRRAKYKALGVTANMTEEQRVAQETKELNALDRLNVFFADMYRLCYRRKRMRRIIADESPWRCQLCLIQGLASFGAFVQKLERREKILGCAGSTLYRSNFLDMEWFSFETAGTMVVGWEGGPSRQPSNLNLDSGLDLQRLQGLDLATDERPRTTGIEFAAAAATGETPQVGAQPKLEDETPRTYNSVATAPPPAKPDASPLTTRATVEALFLTFNYIKQAVVLSHRGKHWTMLQNSCRTLWNCANTALLRTFTTKEPGANLSGMLTMDALRHLVWEPFYVAADCLLDMLVCLQQDREKQAAKARSKGQDPGPFAESWAGDIGMERGGSNLHFEDPLDDLGIVDMCWIRRVVLHAIELLYLEQKWEKLADIALRFSALTNDRYACQVLPILIQAQRRLCQLVKSVDGPPPPQPHYQLLQRQLGHVTTAKDYLTASLKLVWNNRKLPVSYEPGAVLDVLGHKVYTVEDAYRLSSVPLDFEHTLKQLQELYRLAPYTAHTLSHSRRLMILYLAGQQNTVEQSHHKKDSKVDFLPTAARPETVVPRDLTKEEFQSGDDVQACPMPRSQLGVVIQAFERTIETLLGRGEKDLAAQAMHELGNLHYHAGTIRAAYKWWSDAVDAITGMTDALRVWRKQLAKASDMSAELLRRCGVWGCLLGGILTSNIAQYILTSDLGLRRECCFLAGYLFKALFRASLPHPIADRDYALYEVGEGCEVTHLVPGLDFFSNKFRCDGRQLVAALRWVSEELARGKTNLFVLPLLTLYQYMTTFVCRDLQRAVDGRILKVRVLTDVGLFAEAAIVLQRLLHGERLPHTEDSSFRQVESKMSSARFNTNRPINEPSNLRMLEGIVDKRLSSSLATLYGPHMTCHLSLVQAHFLIALADTIPVLPNFEDALKSSRRVLIDEPQAGEPIPAGTKPHTISTMSRGGLGSKGPKITGSPPPKKRDGSTPPLDASKGSKEAASFEGSSDDLSMQGVRRFTDAKRPVTPEILKGTLLLIADQMVSTLSEVIIENVEHEHGDLKKLAAAELELVVLCKLEQSAIALQKHHAPLAARTVLSALKLLQFSDIFHRKKPQPSPPRPSSLRQRSHASREREREREKEKGSSAKLGVKLVEVENSQFQYQNFQSRSRLDLRLWLQCRLALVKCLLQEIRGLGDVKGPDNKVLTELADCRQYCTEGLGEAQACGDVEVQAEFLLQGAHLNIMEGKSLEHTVSLLKDAMKLLREMPHLSLYGGRLYATCLTIQTDLEAVARPDVDADRLTERTFSTYVDIQTILLDQMESLGERIEHYRPAGQQEHLSSPLTPISNIYLPHMVQLVQIKLRIGHAMARNAAKQIRSGLNTEDPAFLWSDALGVLNTALELSQASATRVASLEAELLLNIGRIQKMLVLLGKFQPRVAAGTLIDAIKISYANDHDLGLIRQAYLEIALIYLYSSGMVIMKEGSFLETLESGDEGSKPSTAQSKKKWKSKKERSSKKKDEEMADQEKERRAAWLAIRCASAVAQAQRARSLLIGDQAITEKKLTDKQLTDMPEFVALDLLSPYVLGEKKKVYANEIEEELAPLIEAQEVKQVETYEDQVSKARQSARDLSWIHLLGYLTILNRQVSTATIACSSNQTEREVDGGQLGPEFDLGFISHAQFDTSLNHDVVRSMLGPGPWLTRASHLHHFLSKHLPAYGNDCVAIFPPSQLQLPPFAIGQSERSNTMRSYASNVSAGSDVSRQLDIETSSAEVCVAKPTPPPGSRPEMPPRTSEKSFVTPPDSEITLQWYQPALEEGDPNRPEMGSADRRIILLFALSKKQTMQPGFMWVSLPQLNDLHDRLAVLAQRAEISLTDKEKAKKEAAATGASAKAKKTNRIKALSPKLQRDEKLEGLLQQCLDDCAILLGSVAEQDMASTAEIPFEVNRTNVKILEQLFDPGLGMSLRTSDVTSWIWKMFP